MLLGLGVAGCPMPPTSAQRLTESAYDLNTAARFGRMDVALEHVRDSVRDEFNQRHAAWGRSARIVDYEFNGVTVRPDGDADVTVTVLWQKLDETTMKSTEITQRWTEKRQSWWMISEKEYGGDRGLLAEIKPPAGKGDSAKGDKGEPARSDEPKADGPGVAPAQPARARYQTRTIYEQ
jgi:hypothetical protein